MDRALIAFLLELIPRTQHHRLRLIVTPGTILRWRRDVLRRWAAKSKSKGRPAAWACVRGYLTAEIFGSLTILITDSSTLYHGHIHAVMLTMGYQPDLTQTATR